MLRNIAISNRLDQLCKGMEAIMNAPSHAHLPEDAIDLIEAGRQHALTLLGNIIEPICSALSRQLEDCILQIHDEDFALPESPTDQGTSGSTYITNLQQQSTLSQREVLSRVTCKDVVIPRVKKMLHRLTEMFVRHCCLIRNFGEQGKLRLAADMSEVRLNQAMATACMRVACPLTPPLLGACRMLGSQTFCAVPLFPESVARS